MRFSPRPCIVFVLVAASLAGGCTSARSTPLRAASPADAAATPVLWRHPGPIAARDLFWGAGSPARAPQPPFQFIEEELSGKNPKVVVKDTRGQVWDVKFGEEAHAEIAANRLVWALGYFVEAQYFVRDGTIAGATGLERAGAHIARDGRFRDARFRWRDPATPRTDEEWTFKQNPFVGSREMSGLHIVMTMINNWDIDGARNNKVLRASGPDGRAERWFIVSDLGATFGRMGGGRVTDHSKWTLAHFREERFIDKVDKGMLYLAYDGYDPYIERVPLEHAKWFAGLASQLTGEQVRRAFEAAGATPAEAAGYTTKVMQKIAMLRDLTAATSAP